jgi:hypothetical protein
MDIIDKVQDEVELLKKQLDIVKGKLDKKREQNTNASRRYRETHRDKINSISKKYYDTHKEDPEWLEAKREKQRLYQQKRRNEKKVGKIID